MNALIKDTILVLMSLKTKDWCVNYSFLLGFSAMSKFLLNTLNKKNDIVANDVWRDNGNMSVLG